MLREPVNNSNLSTNDNGNFKHLPAIVSLRNVVKKYGVGATEVLALAGVNLEIKAKQFTAIVGPSGSGKSTLLHCLAGLDQVSSGEVIVNDINISKLNDNKLTLFRRQNIGFIFQAFNLVPTLTAEENICLPLYLNKTKINKTELKNIAEVLGLTQRLHHKPSELSGGQQQRVAIARALLAKPALLVADEPTGNLDSHTGKEVLNILRAAVNELGQTVIMVTHDQRAAATADRVLVIKDGLIANDLYKPGLQLITEVM